MAKKKYESIIYTVEDHVATITINRARWMNSLRTEDYVEITDAVRVSDEDDDVRVIVITGEGRGFCSGEHVQTFAERYEADGWTQMRRQRTLRNMQDGIPAKISGGLVRILMTINTPTIAAVNGPAVGYGCDLALMCDIRVASEMASFGEFFGRRAVVPEEGMLLLPLIVGIGQAYEMIFTTDLVDAKEAYRIGLVNHLVPHDQLMEETYKLAKRIASRPPLAMRLAKQGVKRGLNRRWDEFWGWTSLAFGWCLDSDDHREGVRSFLEKREPEFKGR